MSWRAGIIGIMMLGLAEPALAAAEESSKKGKDGAKGSAEAGLSELPGSSVPGSEEILDAVRERLVNLTKKDLARRAALKEEAERQRKIRQGLADAGVDLQYLPVPEAIKELERMTPGQARSDSQTKDQRADDLYSKIEGSGGDGIGVERAADRDVLIRVLCNRKGSDLDSRTLEKMGMDAEEARRLSSRLCP